MTRETWVRRNGRMVLKQHAGPRDVVHVISDSLGADLEHHGYADGRRTDSKSQFRAWTKQAGLVEKGNDRDRPGKLDINAARRDMQADVARATQMVMQGYRPVLRNIEGD